MCVSNGSAKNAWRCENIERVCNVRLRVDIKMRHQHASGDERGPLALPCHRANKICPDTLQLAECVEPDKEHGDSGNGNKYLSLDKAGLRWRRRRN